MREGDAGSSSPVGRLRALRLYPAEPARRAATVAADVLIAALLVLFALLALSAHDAVMELAAIARGLEDAGGGARAALDRAAASVRDIPLVGGPLAEALRQAGAETGADAEALGRASRRDIEDMADAIGWSLFLIPALLLLVGWLPNRYAQVQRMTAARRILGDGSTAAHPQLVALRAAVGLPYSTLLRYTDDPFGDLERRDYGALLEAAYDDAGIRRRTFRRRARRSPEGSG